MARQRLTVRPVVIPIKLTLHPGDDDDLIDWFARTPDRLRSVAVKAALRGGATLTDQTSTADDTFARLDALIG